MTMAPIIINPPINPAITVPGIRRISMISSRSPKIKTAPQPIPDSPAMYPLRKYRANAESPTMPGNPKPGVLNSRYRPMTPMISRIGLMRVSHSASDSAPDCST